jgi:hypothetical protein
MGLKIGAGLTLDNGLRPQAIAGVAPTLDYRFARDKRETEAVSLTDKLTFTGGNQGTFVGSDGYIQRATTNVPRFDHGPVTRISKGLLVEGSRENLLLRSEEFDNVNWIRVRTLPFGSGSVANATVAPDGTLTADKVVEDATINANHIIYLGSLGLSSSLYSFSVYAKAAERSQLFLRLDAGGGQKNVSFDLSTGDVLIEGVGTEGSITPVGNGWYRCVNTLTTADTLTNAVVMLAKAGTSIYTGDGTSGIYLWGAQLEVGTPSTYIPTTTTAVTRTADSAVIDGTGVLTGTYTMVAKPEGSAIESGGDIVLQEGYTAERVMVFPAALSAAQITAIRSAM